MNENKKHGLIHPADTQCKSCGENIWFNKQPHYKRPIPMNCTPVIATNEIKSFNYDGEFVEIYAGEPHYVSHFATCPKANVYRRKNRIRNKKQFEYDLTYLTNDLSGYMNFLDTHGNTLKKLKTLWENSTFKAKLALFKESNPEEYQKVVEHKDKLKAQYSAPKEEYKTLFDIVKTANK